MPLDSDIVLLDGAAELLLDVIVGGGELHNLLSLSLGSHLELAVALVGGVKGHLELSDGDGHLLLDLLDLNPQLVLVVGQLAGEKVDLLNKLPLGNLELLAGTAELLLKVGLKLSELLLKSSHTVQSLQLASISVLVSTGELLALVTQLAVVAVHVGHALLEGIELHLEGLDLISEDALVTVQGLIGHLEAVSIVGDLHNLVCTSLAVAVGLLVEVGHLLQLGAEVSVGPLRVLELGGDLFDDNLAVLEVLDEDIDLTSQLGLGVLGGLELLLQGVAGVGQSINFQGHLLLEGVSFFNTEAVPILVFLLPVSILGLPLGNGSFQSDLQGAELFDLDSQGLDGALKSLNLGVSSIDISGLIVSSAAQLIELSSELVLVETGVLQRQLHLVKLLGGVLGFHLEPLLSAVHVSHAPVEVSDLDVILVDGDLKLFNNLLDGDLLALEDLNLSVELADLGLHGGLLLDDLLLVTGQPLDLLLELHHRGLVLGSQGVDLLLGLVVNVLKQLPQLAHLGLPLPVDLELALGSRLGLGEQAEEAACG